MRSVCMIAFLALIAHVHAKAMQANGTSYTQDSMADMLVGKLVDKLVDRMTMPPVSSELDDTTLAKVPQVTAGSRVAIPQRATPLLSLQSVSPSARSTTARVQAVQNNLRTYGMGSSSLEKLALTAMDVTTRRDISLRAAQTEMVSGWSTVDDDTKRKLKNVLEQVEAKESVLAGITAPLGFFDPLGFSTSVTGGKLLFYREVELKHGRVAMLASLGILVGEKFHPLFGGDIDVPAFSAFQQTPLEVFWPAVVAAIAIPEIFSVFTFQDPLKGGRTWEMKDDHVPGDLGFDPLGLKPKDPKEFKEMQTKELNNGRLAMIAAAGMIAQEYVTGQKLF